MLYSEACKIATASEATLDELLEARLILAIEHGYRCCKIRYDLQEDNYDLKEEFVPLICRIELLRIKIKQKFNQQQKI